MNSYFPETVDHRIDFAGRKRPPGTSTGRLMHLLAKPHAHVLDAVPLASASRQSWSSLRSPRSAWHVDMIGRACEGGRGLLAEGEREQRWRSAVTAPNAEWPDAVVGTIAVEMPAIDAK